MISSRHLKENTSVLSKYLVQRLNLSSPGWTLDSGNDQNPPEKDREKKKKDTEGKNINERST